MHQRLQIMTSPRPQKPLRSSLTWSFSYAGYEENDTHVLISCSKRGAFRTPSPFRVYKFVADYILGFEKKNLHEGDGGKIPKPRND